MKQKSRLMSFDSLICFFLFLPYSTHKTTVVFEDFCGSWGFVYIEIIYFAGLLFCLFPRAMRSIT